MWVETKCLPQIGDTLRGASLERLELSQEGPSVRMIGIQGKRRRQLRSTLIGPAVKDQHIPNNCMSDGIFSVERNGPLGCRESGNQVMFLSFPPIGPGEVMAHCEPGMRLCEAWIEFDRSLQERTSSSVAFGQLRHQRTPAHEEVVGFEIRGPATDHGRSRRQYI
jgi:hypothetical protein